MAKAKPNLRAAILECLTLEQQKELADMITELARSSKMYGMGLGAQLAPNEIEARILRANAAWNALCLTGLYVQY